MHTKCLFSVYARFAILVTLFAVCTVVSAQTIDVSLANQDSANSQRTFPFGFQYSLQHGDLSENADSQQPGSKQSDVVKPLKAGEKENSKKPSHGSPAEGLHLIAAMSIATPIKSSSSSSSSALLVANVLTQTSQKWEISPSDKTLNAVLARWSNDAGWQLSWELPIDYVVEAHASIPGTFEQAVETVATSMKTAEIPMKAIFYRGNQVLRIVTKEVEQ